MKQEAEEFCLETTLSSGQVFHWRKVGVGEWEGVIGREVVRIFQPEGAMSSEIRILRGDPKKVFHYFSLDVDLRTILSNFPSSDYVRAAVKFCRGLRIIRQPFWECLGTFLFSTQKRVFHIEAISRLLRERYGEKADMEGYFCFPRPERIAGVRVEELRECKLGYRAKYLLGAARAIAEGGYEESELRQLPTGELIERLLQLPGVGRKVSACVALFAFGRWEAVPVDVWVERILRQMFADAQRCSLKKLEQIAGERFGPYAGYLQQYLFHYARCTGNLPNGEKRKPKLKT